MLAKKSRKLKEIKRRSPYLQMSGTKKYSLSRLLTPAGQMVPSVPFSVLQLSPFQLSSLLG